MKTPATVLLLAALLSAACERGRGEGAAAAAKGAQALLEARRYDEAIALVGDRSDPDSLYLLGRAWAGKAQTAPLPTPAPGQLPPSGGLFKPEELTALGFLERAVALAPNHAAARLAIADLLAPHTLAAIRGSGGVSGTEGAPVSAPLQAAGPDIGVERVLRSYGVALQADPAGLAAPEALIRFATAAGRLAEADAAFQELLRRRREDPDLLVRYGDFLAGPAQKADAALSPYAQALIWRPDDKPTRTKMAEIHLRAASSHMAQQEFVSAEARVREARRIGIDEGSDQLERMRQLEEALGEIRGR